MISIGTLLIQPISNKNIWTTFGLAALLILTLLVIEVIQLKWDIAETFFTGKAKIVIENGVLNEKNLKKLRLSVDKLEMRLRQSGIEKISDVQWGTIEPSGQLGYSLVEKKKFATKEDTEKLQKDLDRILEHFNLTELPATPKENESRSNIFSEIEKGHIPPVDDHLQ